MYCSSCGGNVQPEQVYCSRCGQPLAGVTPPPAAAPSLTDPASAAGSSTGAARPCSVAQHARVLGILWIIYSALRLVPGVAMMFFGHTRFPFVFMPLPHSVFNFLSPFLFALGVAVTSLAVAGIVAGIGLLSYRPWARILAIVLACINLIHLPFGTALGIYTLWVMCSSGADQELQRLATCRQ